jgi:hypothetical protein
MVFLKASRDYIHILAWVVAAITARQLSFACAECQERQSRNARTRLESGTASVTVNAALS